jgi:mersacidin/lichenicidin family type 2 lantibiotic
MKRHLIIQAWKDERFRDSLSAEESALVPAHPAGFVDLTDAELELVVGGDATTNTGSQKQQCSCVVTVTGTGDGCFCQC